MVCTASLVNFFFSIQVIVQDISPLTPFVLFPSVNVRLLGERLEANKESKPNHSESQQSRWPSSRSCPSCWREDNSWEQEEVFNHLHNMYWSGNPSYIKIASDNYDTMSSGGWTQSLLRWKFTLVSFVFAMLIRHIYTWKRRKFTSGQHKK